MLRRPHDYMRVNAIVACVSAFLWLTACSSREDAAPPPAGVDLELGRKVYVRVCQECHMPEGQGQVGVVPPLADSPVLRVADTRPLIRIVLHGLQGPIDIKGKRFNGVMPGQGAKLNDAEIASVLSHVRATWAGGAPAIDPYDVRNERMFYASRTMPWNWYDLKRLFKLP
ncbi:MAG: cytochrome c [Opitutaceae bacterium]|nr:cytochrome c [Opitutaceae bacterium]